MEEVCVQCLIHNNSLMRCSRCHTVAYCSVACQKTHWKTTHKAQCIPKTSSSKGLQEKNRMDISRDVIFSLGKQRAFMAMVLAFVYSKSPTGVGTFLCTVNEHEGMYKCTLIYSLVHVIRWTYIPNKANVRFISYLHDTKVGSVSGYEIDECKEEYESLKDLFDFNLHEELVFITDAQDICNLQHKDGTILSLRLK